MGGEVKIRLKFSYPLDNCNCEPSFQFICSQIYTPPLSIARPMYYDRKNISAPSLVWWMTTKKAAKGARVCTLAETHEFVCGMVYSV